MKNDIKFCDEKTLLSIEQEGFKISKSETWEGQYFVNYVSPGGWKYTGMYRIPSFTDFLEIRREIVKDGKQVDRNNRKLFWTTVLGVAGFAVALVLVTTLFATGVFAFVEWVI